MTQLVNVSLLFVIGSFLPATPAGAFACQRGEVLFKKRHSRPIGAARCLESRIGIVVSQGASISVQCTEDEVGWGLYMSPSKRIEL